MHNDEPIFCANADRPRHPHQEIADLLAVALLRLRAKESACDYSTTAGAKDATTLVIASTNSNANGGFATTTTLANFSFTGATASAGTNGSVVSASSTTAGAPGLSGDKNTPL